MPRRTSWVGARYVDARKDVSRAHPLLTGYGPCSAVRSDHEPPLATAAAPADSITVSRPELRGLGLERVDRDDAATRVLRVVRDPDDDPPRASARRRQRERVAEREALPVRSD